MVREAEDLFGAGESGLAFAAFGGEAAAGAGIDLDQFVDGRESGDVEAGGEVGANAEDIDGGAGGDESGDGIFVEIVGGLDAGVGEARVVEELEHIERESE